MHPEPIRGEAIRVSDSKGRKILQSYPLFAEADGTEVGLARNTCRHASNKRGSERMRLGYVPILTDSLTSRPERYLEVPPPGRVFHYCRSRRTIGNVMRFIYSTDPLCKQLLPQSM